MVRMVKDIKVPTMSEETLKFLVKLIKTNNYKTILEIGSAVGDSALYLANKTDVSIVSLEKDLSRYETALKNQQKLGNEQVAFIHADALTYNLEGQFDLIIIDAAKTKNKELFERFAKHLNQDGAIVTDNLALSCIKGKVLNKNRLRLLRKTKEFIDFLKNHEEFTTTFIDIGDKIAITKRK